MTTYKPKYKTYFTTADIDTADGWLYDLEIEYKPGWSTPADFSGHPDTWSPAEGEAPEIVSILVGEHSPPGSDNWIFLFEPYELTEELLQERGASQEEIQRLMDYLQTRVENAWDIITTYGDF